MADQKFARNKKGETKTFAFILRLFLGETFGFYNRIQKKVGGCFRGRGGCGGGFTRRENFFSQQKVCQKKGEEDLESIL
jgi:hypothetical protein